MLPQPLADATFVPDAARAGRGGVTYAHQCLQCHGAGAVSGGKAPDLRASPVVLDPRAFMDVVLAGNRLMNGMPVFPSLTELEAEDIRHYVRSQAALGLPKKGAGTPPFAGPTSAVGPAPHALDDPPL